MPEIADHVEAGFGATPQHMTVREATALIPEGDHLPAGTETDLLSCGR
jgi:hypothetical protein